MSENKLLPQAELVFCAACLRYFDPEATASDRLEAKAEALAILRSLSSYQERVEQ